MKSPKVLEIKEIIEETPTIKTFLFDWDMKGEDIPYPGQFLMVWNFKDEKPMSISHMDVKNGEIGFTVKAIGPFTKDIHSLKAGDDLGLRGPFGNGFNCDFNNKNILAVGGGVGMGPFIPFTEECISNGASVDVVSAATTKDELLFVEELEDIGANVFTCTDDGTCGFKGFATNRVVDLLKNNTYDSAAVCGPEVMMKPIFDLLEENKISAQYDIGRYMKCALGICGQCCVDGTGWRVCKDGPVFTEEQLRQITEFGKYQRKASGIKEFF
ncbi:MAG: dihydroorotate dehydrogenase electron transfer subunit [Methanobacteriaceae archaeon]|jgi:dihydroorotate dehydrogenase electron transfer subunit|nr:dihydroorotate dehydrogenase electron transfer subunit [Methanobacteriaceae archaeon]